MSLGMSKSLYHLADDEGVEVTLPVADWLCNVYPPSDLSILLEPDQTPIPWNAESIYVCLGNPADANFRLPIA